MGGPDKQMVPVAFYPRLTKGWTTVLRDLHAVIIGLQVRRFREQKGWNQTQLTAKLQLAGWDTSQGSLSRLENGERRFPDLELLVLADVLNVKLETLFPKDVRGKIKALWPLYRVKLSRGQLPPRH
jgi:transcriptional regulator with XRE-family HTH domain